MVEVTKKHSLYNYYSKTVDEMALKYNFNVDQIQLLNELLANHNDSLWEALDTIHSE